MTAIALAPLNTEHVELVGIGTPDDLPIVHDHELKQYFALAPDGSRRRVITHIKTTISYSVEYAYSVSHLV